MTVTVDQTDAAAPTLTLDAASDTGVDDVNNETTDDTPTVHVALNGSGATAPAAGDVVKVYSGLTLVASHTLTAGDIAADTVALTTSDLGADGADSLTATITDEAGNESDASNAVTVTIDTTADAAPAASVTFNDGDGIVDASEQGTASYTIAGVDGDATATVTFSDGNPAHDIVVSGLCNGTTTVNLSGLNEGPIRATISVIDDAGNTATGTGDTSIKDINDAPVLTSRRRRDPSWISSLRRTTAPGRRSADERRQRNQRRISDCARSGSHPREISRSGSAIWTPRVDVPDLLSRTIDLSGATSATLTFDYRRDIPNGEANDQFLVLASSDGVTFTQIGQIGATGNGSFVDAAYQTFTFDLDCRYISANTTIRFSVGDDVDGNATLPMTLRRHRLRRQHQRHLCDRRRPGARPDGHLHRERLPVPIGVLSQITDTDDTNMESATITLINHQADDLLAVSGPLPAGITASSYNAATGVLTLTGPATKAAFQTALSQIVFSNSSDNPDPSDRIINVRGQRRNG